MRRYYSFLLSLLTISSLSSSQSGFLKDSPGDVLYYGPMIHFGRYPRMGQGADYVQPLKTAVEEGDADKIVHVEGLSAGAAAAANAVAACLKHPTTYPIHPRSLLYCSGFTDAMRSIREFPAFFVGGPLCHVLQGLPLYNIVSYLGAALINCPRFNPFFWGEHPIGTLRSGSLQYIAKKSKIPIIFVHALDDRMVPVEHAYRNYLSTVRARGATTNNNIYLLTVHSYYQDHAMCEDSWNLPCTVYAQQRDREATRTEVRLKQVVNTIYAQSRGEDIRESGINLTCYQPSTWMIRRLLLKDYLTQTAYFLSKVAIGYLLFQRMRK